MEKVFVARFRNWNPFLEGALLSPIVIMAVFVAALIATLQVRHSPPGYARPVAPLTKVLFRVEPEMR